MKVYCFQNFHIIDLFIHLYFFHLKIPFAFSDLLQYTFLRSQINYEDLLFSVFNVSIMFFFFLHCFHPAGAIVCLNASYFSFPYRFLNIEKVNQLFSHLLT